jgi:predicted ATPase
MMVSGKCACSEDAHAPKLVVLTGGPGAGKSAVLEIVRRTLCRHVAVLPEAATVLFGGGFPRRPSNAGRRHAQRAIFQVQREMELLYEEECSVAVVLCDRGTLDGAAYWPGGPGELARDVGIELRTELARYAAVIHLRTPAATQGYDRSNVVRVESASEAKAIDGRIEAAWTGHPRRFFVESADDFLSKVARAVALIREELPACCRSHPVAELGEDATRACDCER